MATQLATADEAKVKRVSIIDKMAGQYDMDPKVFYDTLSKTVFKGCNSNEEFAALCIVANEHGLNPFTKEIYAFPAKGGGIVPLVSIDGWLRIMNEHPQFDGISHQDIPDEKGNLTAVECTIWRKDREHPIKIIEYLEECKRSTEPWKNMPARMLRHKATIQCARYAFGFSGIYDEQDVDAIVQGGNVRQIGTPPLKNATQHDESGEVIDAETGEVYDPQAAADSLYRDKPSDQEVAPDAEATDDTDEEKPQHERMKDIVDADKEKKAAEEEQSNEPALTLDMAKVELDRCELAPDVKRRLDVIVEMVAEDDVKALRDHAADRIAELSK